MIPRKFCHAPRSMACPNFRASTNLGLQQVFGGTDILVCHAAMSAGVPARRRDAFFRERPRERTGSGGDIRLHSPARDRQECLSHRGSSAFPKNWADPREGFCQSRSGTTMT